MGAGDREDKVTVNVALKAAGWRIVRVWEHQDAEAAADRMEAAPRRTLRDG